jgi:hypothetical protein
MLQDVASLLYSLHLIAILPVAVLKHEHATILKVRPYLLNRDPFLLAFSFAKFDDRDFGFSEPSIA